MYKHIMLDLETWGVTADSELRSIGAVKFNVTGELCPQGFYSNLLPQKDRKRNPDTVEWWKQQPEKAQRMLEIDPRPLHEVLIELTEFFSHPDYEVWSNGASFDIPMLEHAFGQFHMHAPWKFWNSRCYRTMKMRPWALGVVHEPPVVAHNALFDAVAQATTLQRILRLEAQLRLTRE